MKKIIRILYFIIPVLLIGIIISKIDFIELGEIYRTSNKVLLGLTFLSFPLRYLIFTFRWKLVLNMYGKSNISFFRLLKTIYIGIFAGFFVPASVGIDIYRVVGLKNTRTSEITIGLIFQEKLMGLLVCSFFVLFFSRYLEIDMGRISPFIGEALYGVIIIAIIIVIVLLRLKKSKIAQQALQFVENKLIILLKWFTKKFSSEVKIEEGFINKVLKICLNPKMIIVVILFGILNQVIGAVFANIGFRAMDEELSLVFNLFANPLMNIIFLLPISFGGFGIREGAYILIFGLVGIAAEVSLLVSSVFLISGFLNVAIGGIVFLLNKKNLNE